jgi:hypothetical protein
MRPIMHQILEAYVQPSRPPLPVAKNRPLQIAGSHISNVMLERVEVGIERATRHRFVETTWFDRLQVGSLYGNVRFVPAGTYSST